jgi:phosphoribosylformylglycinamidine synthase
LLYYLMTTFCPVETKTMKPLILKGSEALSEFRIKAILEKYEKAAPNTVKSIDTHFVYLVEIENELPKQTLDKAFSLLNAEEIYTPVDGDFFVTPRKGTISPWSSKATDIFKNCGIKEIPRVERGIIFNITTNENKHLYTDQIEQISHLLYDKMTEGLYANVDDIFHHIKPAPFLEIKLLEEGHKALEKANVELGLALSDDEIDYLFKEYSAAGKNPTDVELVMFGQVNSEHCRHKIFNADWVIDGEEKDLTLFKMIQNTHKEQPEGTLVAYSDNSGVLEGFEDTRFEVTPGAEHIYGYTPGKYDIVIKVETHNHPTAISPYPGAATGVGGEIRDECATGTAGKTKAGLCGFMVSNLNIPGFEMPWEKNYSEFPDRLSTPLEIMLEGPIGGANFGNEFGRPQLLGFFKTYEEVCAAKYRGYHKPIMLAGGMGSMKRVNVEKKDIGVGALVIQLGGPAMRIGLGGGAASSMDTGSNAAELDFDSVQRGSAEMERRCQEVIDTCAALGADNPILSIHDIGAGGLSNGCPELIEATGAVFKLRNINNEDLSMSPMEIWCCEAQERYVLAILPEDEKEFMAMCERERCPAKVIGVATGDGKLVLEDEHFNNKPIDIDLGVILGNPPKMLRDVEHLKTELPAIDTSEMKLDEAIERVLKLPAVANKTFLISITDRSITGMVAQDQMVGPFQTPVADSAVTTTSLTSTTGEVMSCGERTNSAIISHAASGRMAVAEAITNIAGTNVKKIKNIKLSANWMCACGEEGEDAGLYDTVKAIGMELCPELGLSIPVGKDSLSMRTVWQTSDGENKKQIAPLSLVITAFAPVYDVNKTVTPELKAKDSSLILIDLGKGKNRLGGSALARVYNQIGNDAPDVDKSEDLLNFFNAMQKLVDEKLILAYHDRSDGGAITTMLEMAFAARRGLEIDISGFEGNDFEILFNEEAGAVIQVAEQKIQTVQAILAEFDLGYASTIIAKPQAGFGPGRTISITRDGETIYKESLTSLNRTWCELTYKMQTLRDNPEVVKQEFDELLDENNPGISIDAKFEYTAPTIAKAVKPKMAILREQGINGQIEMAAAFDKAGFESIDVHMTDLLSGKLTLEQFSGLVACGGFSYGDVLGAGSGWGKSILFNEKLKDMFAAFFANPNTFSLGVCNGCQMLSQLKDIIPGAENWPAFTKNRCEQFEARYITLKINETPSILFKGMENSKLAIPVAHGEGFANFDITGNVDALKQNNQIVANYVNNYGEITERYPLNPNGSKEGITSVTSLDGRATIMMPHPERVFRSLQMAWAPESIKAVEEGPWLQLFKNAYNNCS